jgi:hypothetical protein
MKKGSNKRKIMTVQLWYWKDSLKSIQPLQPASLLKAASELWSTNPYCPAEFGSSHQWYQDRNKYIKNQDEKAKLWQITWFRSQNPIPMNGKKYHLTNSTQFTCYCLNFNSLRLILGFLLILLHPSGHEWSWFVRWDVGWDRYMPSVSRCSGCLQQGVARILNPWMSDLDLVWPPGIVTDLSTLHPKAPSSIQTILQLRCFEASVFFPKIQLALLLLGLDLALPQIPLCNLQTKFATFLSSGFKSW